MSLASAAELRALAVRLVTPELVLFPVRHHSPACAWQLQQLLRTTRPSAVLVEGPRSFTPLVPLLVHPQARMPLAIYTYAVEADEGDVPGKRHAAFYPFCDYSPELVALRAAHEAGVPARFIDLDYAEQCLLQGAHEKDEAQSLLDERPLRRSKALQLLARRLGCRDHEELWEHLFEVLRPERDLQQHGAGIAAYCQLARVDCSEDELRADGTLQREAEMAWQIRAALAERGAHEGPVLVVLGGFHAVAMPALLRGEVTRPVIPRGKISDEAAALIRYGFDRLDRLNGYSAGMTSPAWHQALWERTQQHARAGVAPDARVRHDIALEWLQRLASELRDEHGVALPLPTVRDAWQHLLRLTMLRGRAAPVRADLLDAITSCFVQGDSDGEGAIVLAAARRMLGGDAMGTVPPGAGTPPLVHDFLARARRQRLKIDDGAPRRVLLDIYRRADHRATSRLLHGLVLLDVPFAQRTAGPDFVTGQGLARLQEHWTYRHSAETEAALVEASVHGVTVPLAVAHRFLAQLHDAASGSIDAREAAALLAQACVLGLHDHVAPVLALLRTAIAAEAVFESVAAAAGALGVLWESREPLEARGLAELPPLLQAAYARALYLARGLRGLHGDGSESMDGLARLRELLVSQAGAALDAELYWQQVQAMQRQHDAALVRGACAGLLYTAGRLDEDALGAALQGHLAGLVQPREAVAFLRGLLAMAHEAAWQQPVLLQVLDRQLRTWDEASFVAVLPELRLAFAEMTPRETDRIAAAAARLHGVQDLGPLVHHDASAREVQARLAASVQLLDVLVADGLADWVRE